MLVLLALAGCQSGRHKAAELPPSLYAPEITNAQTVDLSRLAMASSDSELIEHGDVIEVTISAGLSLEDTITIPVRVSDEGIANISVIGSVPLGGLTLQDAEAAISAASVHRGLYRSPQVTVTMKRQRTNRVTVVGAVKEPGVYELPRGRSDLLAALVAAGGLDKDAGTEVEIRHPGRSSVVPGRPGRGAPPVANRGGDMSLAGHSFEMSGGGTPKSLKVDLISATGDEAAGDGYYVEDGGVISVERRVPKPVHVLGLVRKPGRYELPVTEELRVLDAISMAEGISSLVADKVFVIRQLPGQPEPAVIEISLRKAKRDGATNIRLAAGDIVSVEQTPATVVLDVIRLINVGVGASLNTLF